MSRRIELASVPRTHGVRADRRRQQAPEGSHACVAAARDTQKKRNDLLETVQGMEKLAIRLLERQDDERARDVMKVRSGLSVFRAAALRPALCMSFWVMQARCLLESESLALGVQHRDPRIHNRKTYRLVQEKAMYQEQLDKLDAKVNDLLALEDKLHLAIEKKTSALSNIALEQGHEFRDDAAGVSIVYGPQLARGCARCMVCKGAPICTVHWHHVSVRTVTLALVAARCGCVALRV